MGYPTAPTEVTEEIARMVLQPIREVVLSRNKLRGGCDWASSDSREGAGGRVPLVFFFSLFHM